MRAILALTNLGYQSRAYLLNKTNYALATIIILLHILFWSPYNDANYVPKSQRPNHYAWMTHGIKQATNAIAEWEVSQSQERKRTQEP